jgi:zinc protease
MVSRSPHSVLARSCLALALGSGCAAVTKAGKGSDELPQPSRDLKFPDQGFQKDYANGITLFVLPDPYTRLVQFDVRQRVGMREDPSGKSGMAHFVEHLMFQMPSDGPGSVKLMSALPQHTLSFNAYTTADETHYMHTGTAEELENYFKYTALRLNYDCDAVSENEFLREREVVRNEHRWRGENFDAFVYDKVVELAFPEGHPYRQKNLADADAEVASITPQDACDFIKRYYTASQADVVITGDVDPLEALELANKYLEPLPKVKPPPREPVPPPQLRHDRVEVKAPVKHPTAVIVFQMPKRFSKNYAAATAAQQTLFLSVAFFTATKPTVVQRWYPTGLGGKEAFLLGVAIETKKPGDLDRGIDEVLSAINRGFAADVKGKDYKGSYDSVRQQTRLQILDGISGIFSRSGAFADYLESDTGFYGVEIAQIDDLTAEQAHETGKRLFSRDTAMIVKVVPDGTQGRPKVDRAEFDYKPKEDEQLAVPEDIDPAEAHRPLELTDIAPPEGQSVEMELENGMRVVLVQSSQIPVMDIQLVVGAGTLDSPERAELAQMAARFYDIREGDRDAMNLMSFFDLAGGIFRYDVGTTATTYRSRGMSIYLDFLLAGLSERVVQAEYQSGRLEGWKDNRKATFKKKKSALQSAERQNTYFNALYGKGHPHVQEVITDPKRMREIGLKDLEGFRDAHYRAANSAIIITGGFDMDLAIQYVEKFFGEPVLRDRKNAWMQPKAGAGRPPAPEPRPGDIRWITEIDRERAMTDVQIGYPLAEAYGDDHAALQVMASMLNHGVESVRQKLGASYGIYARLDTERPGIFVGGALDSTRAGLGLQTIRAAIQELRDGKDFDRQFAFARRNVLTSMINAQADPQLLAGNLAQAVRHGRSYEYFQDLARRIATLKPEQVKAQIDRVLRDERSVTMVRGPAEGVNDILLVLDIKGAHKLPDVVHDEDEF